MKICKLPTPSFSYITFSPMVKPIVLSVKVPFCQRPQLSSCMENQNVLGMKFISAMFQSLVRVENH